MNTPLAESPRGGSELGPFRSVRSGLSRRSLIGGAAVAAVGVSAGVAAFSSRGDAPSFEGATRWLNSASLQARELRGHVVLVDFWTFTCINWVRTAPYIRAWHRAYRDEGLVVIGVHTPEFSFEHDIDLVRRAARTRELEHPIAVDNDYAVWGSFDNNYWPAQYLLAEDGSIGYHHFGEGHYETTERALQEMLGVRHDLVTVAGEGVEAEADWGNLRTPETYLGYRRATGFADPAIAVFDNRSSYELPDELPQNGWALAGEWTIRPEKIEHVGETNASIAYRFHARDVHLVLSPGSRTPVRFRVLLDGRAPGASRGVDVDENGNGILRESRLYQLIRAHGPVGERTMQITFDGAGAEAYAFTFG